MTRSWVCPGAARRLLLLVARRRRGWCPGGTRGGRRVWLSDGGGPRHGAVQGLGGALQAREFVGGGLQRRRATIQLATDAVEQV